MSDGSIALDIKIGSDGLIRGLKIASTSVDDASELMRSSLARIAKEAAAAKGPVQEFGRDVVGVGRDAEGASGSLGGLGDVIKEYGKTQRTEGRMGRFLASDLQSMGIASKSAAGELTGLVSAFALGGPIGIGIEVVKLAVTAFNDLGKEEAKTKEELKKFAIDAADSVGKVREQVDALIASLNGATEADKLFHSSVGPALREEFDLKQKLLKAQLDLSTAQQKASAYVKANYHGAREESQAMAAFTSKETEEVERLTHALEAKKQQIEASNAQVKRAEIAVGNDDQNKQRADDEKEEDAHNLRMMALKASLLTGEAKLRAEYSIKVAGIRERENSTEEQDDQEIALQKRILDQQITDLHNKQNDEREKAEAKHQAMILNANFKAQEALTKFFKEQDDVRLKDFLRVQAEEEKSLKEHFAVVKSIADGIGAAMAGVLDHTISVKKAFADMAKAVIHSLIEMAIKAIEAYAASAAGAAFFSQIGIPLIGPFLAVGAAAAASALVLGLLSAVPSAAGGYDIPAGVNPMVQTHAREMILPAKYADMIRGMADGGGGGGGGFTVNINAVDGPSVRRMVESPDFAAALREAQRNGRIS